MKERKNYRYDLFAGVGLVCGGGSGYINRILRRDDAEAMRGDLEAIGRDMYNAMRKANENLKPTRAQNRESVSG